MSVVKRLFHVVTRLFSFLALPGSLPFLWDSVHASSLVCLSPPLRHLCSSSSPSDSHPGESDHVDFAEFKQWRNGGGWVHMLAKIEPSVVVEIGAVVHSKCTLGADIHLGSGAIIGPCVEIGQATKVGYDFGFCYLSFINRMESKGCLGS